MELQAQANRVISTMMRFGVLGALKAELGMRGLPVGPLEHPIIRSAQRIKPPCGTRSMRLILRWNSIRERAQVDAFKGCTNGRDMNSLIDAEVAHHRNFLSEKERRPAFGQLRDLTPWEQHVVRLFGRSHPAPRLSAWYGDPGATYSYSGLKLSPSRGRRCSTNSDSASARWSPCHSIALCSITIATVQTAWDGTAMTSPNWDAIPASLL